MTCREKLEIEHPKNVDDKYIGGCVGCPHTYGYAKEPEWCKRDCVEYEYCRKCWDREAEEVENSTKDSGERTVLARDMGAGKGRCDLLPA